MNPTIRTLSLNMMEEGQSDVSQTPVLPEQSSPFHAPPLEHSTDPDNVFGGGDHDPSSPPTVAGDAATAVVVASADYSSIPEEYYPSVTHTDVYAADYSTVVENVMGRGEHVHAVSAIDGAFAAPDVSNPPVLGDTGETKPEDTAMDAGVTVARPENVLALPAEAVSYGAMNMNGSAAEMMNYQSTGVVENGCMAGDVGGMVVEQQFEEVYSLEEERLWNLVRSNCLDFDAWTSLIDETEKVSEDGDFDLVTTINGVCYYHHLRHKDYVSDYLLPTPTEFHKAIEQYRWVDLIACPVMFSTLKKGKIVKGLAGIPLEGPAVFVGYHMLMGFELGHLVSRFLSEKNIHLRGLGHPYFFNKEAEQLMPDSTSFDGQRIMGVAHVTAANFYKLLSQKSFVLLYPGGAREALHKKVASEARLDFGESVA